MLLLFLLTAELPHIIIEMTPYWNENYALIAQGFNIYDILLLAMLVVIIPKWIKNRNKMSVSIKRVLDVFFIFLAWLFFEVIRNVFQYGLSVFGEFRYEYLLLVIPVYITLFFNSKLIQDKLFSLIKIFTIFLPVICFPIVGLLKGFSFGPENRFFSAAIELGFPLAFFMLLLRQKLIKEKQFNSLTIFSLIICLLLIFLDTNRSVIISLTVGLIVYFLLGNIKISFKKVIRIAILVVLVLSILSFIGYNFQKDFLNRVQAYTNPSNDQTSDWRLQFWVALIPNILKNPLMGMGFGGWWKIYVPELHTVLEVTPHSFYIESLTKIGLIGMVLFLTFLFYCYKHFYSIFKCKLTYDSYYRFASMLGIITLFIMLIFYVAYTPVYYELILLGFTLSITVSKNGDLNKNKLNIKAV